jgi:hypothetical protein
MSYFPMDLEEMKGVKILNNPRQLWFCGEMSCMLRDRRQRRRKHFIFFGLTRPGIH